MSIAKTVGAAPPMVLPVFRVAVVSIAIVMMSTPIIVVKAQKEPKIMIAVRERAIAWVFAGMFASPVIVAMVVFTSVLPVFVMHRPVFGSLLGFMSGNVTAADQRE